MPFRIHRPSARGIGGNGEVFWRGDGPEKTGFSRCELGVWGSKLVSGIFIKGNGEPARAQHIGSRTKTLVDNLGANRLRPGGAYFSLNRPSRTHSRRRGAGTASDPVLQRGRIHHSFSDKRPTRYQGNGEWEELSAKRTGNDQGRQPTGKRDPGTKQVLRRYGYDSRRTQGAGDGYGDFDIHGVRDATNRRRRHPDPSYSQFRLHGHSNGNLQRGDFG